MKTEAGAVLLWVVASVVFAAVVSPWLYGLGKDFAMRHVGEAGVWGSLAGSCERAKPGRYFNRALMLGALVFLWPLWVRVRAIGRIRDAMPARTWADIGWKVGLGHGAVGLLLAAGLLGILGLGLWLGGAFVPTDQGPPLAKTLGRALVPAMGASVVEEWLFRGVLLGLWLRVSGPWMACVGTSLVFAFVHFLEPPPGVELADPRAWHAGFDLVGLILRNFLNPQFIAGELLTLFVVGMALGWARLRTGSLWLPMGMHAGWIFAYKCFHMHHVAAEGHWLRPWLVGDSLRVGLLPVITVAATWLALAGLLRVFPDGRPRGGPNPG